MARAVVSTSVGWEGLRTLDGENILVRDSPEAFAEAVARGLADSDLRARLRKGRRRTVEELYSRDIIGSRMRELYRGLRDRIDRGAFVGAGIAETYAATPDGPMRGMPDASPGFVSDPWRISAAQNRRLPLPRPTHRCAASPAY